MNLSASVKCATVAIAPFLLVACTSGGSPSFQTLAVPGSSGMAVAHRAVPSALNRKTAPMKILRLQAEGKLPGPVPPRVLQWQLAHADSARPDSPPPPCPVASVKLWATVNTSGELIGQKTGLVATCKTISVAPALYPAGVKVDHAQNVWVANEESSVAMLGGDVQEYLPSGVLASSYIWAQCLPAYTSCTGSGFDAAENSANVFAAVTEWSSTNGNGSDSGTGFEWWPAGSPSSSTFISAGQSSLGTLCSPICDVYFMDVDNSGNLWFDFYGMDAGCTNGGYGLAEVTNPTTSPSVSIIFPPCTYLFAGGVYVSGGGTILNVTDQNAHVTYQYAMPVTSGSTPFTLGPTMPHLGNADPVSGGFNLTEKKMAFGDAYGWIDRGTFPPAAGTWVDRLAAACAPGCYGAAFTPSDK